MSLISVDFPEPLTPVTETKTPSGTLTSISFKLFSFAPLIVSLRFRSTGLRTDGISIALRPERYAPVIDYGESIKYW